MTTERIAVVTGASRGSGRAIAQRRSADGYHVIGTSRSGESVDQHIDRRPRDYREQLMESIERYRTEMDGRMANFFRRVMPQRPFYSVLARRFAAAPAVG